MFITTQNEIVSLMPTARWSRPEQLLGYLEEEERVALEPLLGTVLYERLLSEYDRLREKYTDITATTVRATKKAKQDARLAYADVTERIEQIQNGKYRETYTAAAEGDTDVTELDMQTIRLIRICQQIEFYKMLSHKAGLLTVSFNEGGGMNVVGTGDYDPADEKAKDRLVKDSFMSAGRSIDSLLLFLESDAKGARLFTEAWSSADAFYLHKDLLFQTAKVLNEYLDIKGDRMAYVQLVRDIRFCQNTYLEPRVGAKLLKAVVSVASNGVIDSGRLTMNDSSDSSSSGDSPNDMTASCYNEVYMKLLSLLRTALAFYVESRRTELVPVKEKLARRDSMTDAQQAMAAACAFIEENLDALGDAAVGTPIYNHVRAREEQVAADKANACAAAERRKRATCDQNRRKLFTGFPMTHRSPERS